MSSVLSLAPLSNSSVGADSGSARARDPSVITAVIMGEEFRLGRERIEVSYVLKQIVEAGLRPSI